MPTTIHLSAELLKKVDRRATELGISRNRYIAHALRRAVEAETGWSPRFLKAMAHAAKDRESHDALDEMMKAIAAARTGKAAPKL